MSCFIMSAESHAVLANTLEYVLNSGFNRFGFDAPGSLHAALSDCRDRYCYYNSSLVYVRLYELNSAAYNSRYKVTPQPDGDRISDMPEVPQLVEPRQYRDHHETLLPWHYKFAKLLDCLIYQCSEDATIGDPLLLALIDFSRIYKSFLVTNHDEYASAPWGTI